MWKFPSAKRNYASVTSIRRPETARGTAFRQPLQQVHQNNRQKHLMLFQVQKHAQIKTRPVAVACPGVTYRSVSAAL